MNCFTCLSEIHWQCFRNCNLRVRHSNFKRAFFERHVFFLSDFKWKIFAFINFLLAEVVKTAFYVSIRSLWEKFISWKQFSQSFLELSGIFSEFYLNFSVGVVKTALYESRRTSCRKVFLFEKEYFLTFSDIERETLAQFWVFFRHGCHNCILRVWMIFLKEKKYLLEQKFGHVSRIMSGFFSAFCRSFSDCLVKIAF